MKILYRVSDGEVIAAGPMPDLTAGPGEAVADIDSDVPKRLDYIKFDGAAVVEKTKQEKDKADKDKKDKQTALIDNLKALGFTSETLEAIRTLQPEDLK